MDSHLILLSMGNHLGYQLVYYREFRVIVPERFSVCRISSSWCTDIWCKPRRFGSGILMGTTERLCIKLGNRCC